MVFKYPLDLYTEISVVVAGEVEAVYLCGCILFICLTSTFRN